MKLAVNDTIAWDVIAVVEGHGSVGERTERVLRDTAGSVRPTLAAWRTGRWRRSEARRSVTNNDHGRT